MIRAFVAIGLPEAVRGTLEAAQSGLPAGRPVPAENLHLTLVFLGEHPEPAVEDVHLALQELRAPGFQLRIDGVGMFGGAVPRLLYAGVAPEPGLAHLRKKVARAAREGGITPEGGRYTPHVTLARFPRDLSGEDLLALQEFVGRRTGLAAGPFEVEGFGLYRSHLGRNGPIYQEIAHYRLDPPADRPAGPRGH